MCLGKGCMQVLRSKTSEQLESCFYNYGILVSHHPWKFIFLSLLLTLICSLGLLNFHQEKNPMKLWIPPESEFKRDTDWFMSGFGEGYRIQAVMVTGPDVLQPHVMQQVIQTAVPVVQLNKRRKRNSNNDLMIGGEDEGDYRNSLFYNFEPSVDLPTSFYCTIVSSFSTGCYEHSLLEFWKYDEDEIATLTKEDIIFALNHTTISPVLGLSMEYTHLLGGTVRNESGVIVAASSLLSQWMVHVNFSEVDMEVVGNDGGTADWATGQGMIWEQSFLNTMENISSTLSGENDTEILYEASRSFGDISSAAMFQDMLKIVCGVFLTFFFVLFVLSKPTCLEIRVIPAAAGMACVGLAFVSACGLCSAMGIFYGPVHTSLPFLLMGIGVDDMFVIMACRNHLTYKQKSSKVTIYQSREEKHQLMSRSSAVRYYNVQEMQIRACQWNSLPVQIGLALRHAGVSITVTSFTDIVASTIGGTTILPALESFCLYAAAGVFFTFIYQATFFVAFLVLDEYRIEKRRNPFLLCITHKTAQLHTKNEESNSMTIIKFLYSKIILTKPVKVLVILATCCFTGFCMRGVLSLRQQFDPKWFLPSDSYLIHYLDARDRFYADSGQEAFILLGQLNYTSELKNIHKLVKDLRAQKDIVKDVDTWYEGFRYYVNYHFHKDIPNTEMSEDDFSLFIGKYLFSPSGGKFQKNFRFAGKLECGEKAPPITVSTLDFKFRLFSGPEVAVPAMNRVKDMVRRSNISSGDGFKTVWSKAFATWTTDEVIQHELYRNLALSVVCVMATTTLLILNIPACFWIFVCVLLTLVDICGMMHYWGLTVDIVSCIALVLGVGLCIDYAAHVGQTFLHAQGSRHQRAVHTVSTVGTAVLNGGLSTLLALSMLSLSDAYIFQSFFKIFFLVVTIGLFHGIVFLPVVMSLIGPDAHTSLLEHDLRVVDSAVQGQDIAKEDEMASLANFGDKNIEIIKDSDKTNRHSR